MGKKKVLIIGGTGQISTSLTHLLDEQGHDVTIFNRGQRNVPVPENVTVLIGDRTDKDQFAKLMASDRFDVIFDFICWNREDAEQDVQVFQDRCDQFFYISTAWVYGPPSTFPTPEHHKRRPVETYGLNKNGAEDVFWSAKEKANFPVTVIRFHATYDDHAGWGGVLAGDQTPLFRMTQGKPILLHDRGTHITQFLHSDDAAWALKGLMDNPTDSVGEAFNVAGEPVTWRDYYLRLAQTFDLNCKFASIPSELLIQWAAPHAWPLMGVHQFNILLDTSKLFRVVPDLQWRVSIEEGFRRKWSLMRERGAQSFDIDPDPQMTERIDGILSRWEGMTQKYIENKDEGWRSWIQLQ